MVYSINIGMIASASWACLFIGFRFTSLATYKSTHIPHDDIPNDDVVLSPLNNDDTNDDTNDVIPKNDKNLLTPNIFNDVVPLTENANKFTNKCDNLL